MHLEDAGTTYKAVMRASKYLFEAKKNVVFDRLVFRQAIQRKNEPLINFVTRLGITFEFANQNTEIEKEFIDKCSYNCLRCLLLQEPNLESCRKGPSYGSGKKAIKYYATERNAG